MAQCPSCHAPLENEASLCAGCGADVNWWLSRDAEVYGPYSLATVRFILADKRARLTDPAMIGSQGAWKPLGELIGPDEELSTTIPAVLPLPDNLVNNNERPNYRSLSRQGWTIFVVACIILAIGISAIIIWPAYRDTYGQSAVRDDAGNLEMIGVALELYAQEHNNTMPTEGTWMECVGEYISDEAIYSPYIGPDATGYEILPGIAGANCATWENPENIIVLQQITGEPETRLRLYGDWMVRAETEVNYNSGVAGD